MEKRPDETRRSLTAGLIALAATSLAPPTTRATPPVADFRLFDALLFHGKPNLTHQGLAPMVAVVEIWRPGLGKARIDEPGVAAAIARLPRETDTIYVDVEDWLLLGVSKSVMAQSVADYLRTAEIVRRQRPNIKFGFYGIAPSCTYWPIILKDKAQLAQWREVNRAMRPFAEFVDFMLPSLYTFYDDPAGWRQYAKASLDEAKQYGKPVYPFLWNEYFDGNETLGGHQVKLTDWRDELAFCREHADGAVFWGGYQKSWSESAEWWQAVLEFRRTLAPQQNGNHAVT